MRKAAERKRLFTLTTDECASSDTVQRLRHRARDCRDLAARDQIDRRTLEEIAAELDVEADKIEAEETTIDLSKEDPAPPVADS